MKINHIHVFLIKRAFNMFPSAHRAREASSKSAPKDQTAADTRNLKPHRLLELLQELST